MPRSHPPRWRRHAAALVVVTLTAPAAAAAQAPPTVHVRGTVITADAAPVAGVAVTLHLTGRPDRQLTTTDDGTFDFGGITYGPAVLRVRRIGFSPDSIPLAVDADAAHPFAVVLTAAPQSLAPVVVKAAHAIGPIADFYHRRATGQGRYIARADIERQHPSNTTDLLRRVPGLSMTRYRGQMLLRFRGSTCAPEVFIDGASLGPMPMDFDTMGPGTIEGIEVYSGVATVPVEFTRTFGRTACGTVLVWTRDGERREKPPRGAPITTEQLASLIDGAEVFTAAQVDSSARLTSDIGSEIHVPVSLSDWTAPATVMAEFVIDSSGHVEPLTINVVASSGPGFADAVRSALSAATFTPAMRSGRPVRQFTQLNVVLDPNRRPE